MVGKKWIIVLVATFFGSTPITTAGDIVFCQPEDDEYTDSNGDGTYFSCDIQYFRHRVADRFALDQSRMLQTVRWTGGYGDIKGGGDCVPLPNDDFVITVYPDSNGAPDFGNPVGGPYVIGNNVNRLLVRAEAIPVFDTRINKYSYSADIIAEEPLALQQGVPYWLEIVNLTPFPCGWVWQIAPDPPGDGLSLQDDFSGDYSKAEVKDADMSMCLLDGCPADLDGSDAADFGDLVRILGAWGNNGGPEDLDDSGTVDTGDLLVVLAAWGPCPGRTGACCLDDDTCFEGIESACVGSGGTFLGVRSTCETTCLGACCFDDGTCQEPVDESQCENSGGFYQGDGTSCALSCRVGACCFSDGTCVDGILEGSCVASGGYYEGDDRTCADGCSLERDSCGEALTIIEGSFDYSTIGASTDGPDLPSECDEGSGLGFQRDVWFRYAATCDGLATASVCDSNFNTRMAIYADGACPGPIVACNDDDCGVADTRSEASFPVEAGGIYLIRIGSRNGSIGTGTLLVTCTP